MESLQAQYDAQRDGRPSRRVLDEAHACARSSATPTTSATCTAMGRPTTVPLRDVLASSPAERSGLQPGDEIVAYNGKRVFDVRELNALTLEGTPGESVVVDVRRDGQNRPARHAARAARHLRAAFPRPPTPSER